MDNKVAKLSDVSQDILYKLRLNKLDKTSRILQRENVTDSNGFLTVLGAQVYLDYLWQNDTEAHKAIADNLSLMRKDEKCDKKKKDCKD